MNAKSLGIFGLLVVLFVFMVIMTSEPWYDFFSSTFLQPNNIENLLRRVSMYGLLGIGVAFVIITGGIDLTGSETNFGVSERIVERAGRHIRTTRDRGEAGCDHDRVLSYT